MQLSLFYCIGVSVCTVQTDLISRLTDGINFMVAIDF